MPEIKRAVVQGELSLSQARRIVPVLTPTNHQSWIAKAKSLPQAELEREVTAQNPKAQVRERIRPLARELSELKVAVDPKTEDNLKALKDLLSQKLQRPATLAEVVAWAAEVCREKWDPVKRAERSRSVSSGKPKLGRHPIPAGVRHPVTVRDQGQCTYVGPDGRRCAQKRWLALHHVIEVAQGGLNTVENLRTLCHAHHARIHSLPQRKIEMVHGTGVTNPKHFSHGIEGRTQRQGLVGADGK